ncbi:cytochrome P450 [Stereum hirsutum FP-91666 SS1]|uniref:cytochrome P450 n=1 Tax=Stereum hirsutum (strain FP-91666) TaxID=721885 RepID=UPI0004449772|nr:cytochrome P450 [Stereum hirsutum FP-91666 SS1]EIM84076.1 cytochrome P450 [Stereum hirsutum FP-91666 SS1]
MVLLALYYRQRKTYTYPPGPKGLPVIGNVLDMPRTNPWIAFRDWSRKMDSPVIGLNMMGMTMVVLNDLNSSVDLLEKRGSVYSNRPRFPMMAEACGLGWAFPLTNNMEDWKICRRYFDPFFRKAGMMRYRESQLSMARSLLTRLLDSPERFVHHIHYVTGSMIIDIAYGIHAQPEGDEFIGIADRALRGIEKCTNMSIIDILPWVQHIPSWIPGMWWKMKVDTLKSQVLQMSDVPYEWVKEQLSRGLAKPCVATDLISRFDDEMIDTSCEHREYIIKSISGTVYAAGSDTSVSALNTLFLVMALFPDVQRRAHEEIDRVVGSNRVPELFDQDNLPYITAIVKEILRWAPPLPLGMPHCATSAEIYNGYYIPKGATVLANSWAILRDPAAYFNPDDFNPSRFLTPDGTKIDPNVRDPEAVFGFGRRLCPGRFLSLESLWITTACVLAMFNIKRKVDDDGVLLPMPEELFTLGIVSHPAPFPCSITPRSEASVKLIRAVGVTQDA